MDAEERHFDAWELWPEERPCPWCRGSGRDGPRRCPDCGGAGRLPEEEDPEDEDGE